MKYRVEWMHNGQWKMDEDNSNTFDLRADAEKAELAMIRASKNHKMETRIVEVAYP